MSEKNQKFQGCLPTKYSRCSGRFDFTSDRRCEHADDCARFQALRFLDRECGIENYTDIEVYMAADNCEYKIGPEVFNVINGYKMSEEQTKYDPKARYYNAGNIETLDIIKAKLTVEQYKGFCLGNAMKYICRAEHKGNYNRDIEKAIFYLKQAAGKSRQ